MIQLLFLWINLSDALDMNITDVTRKFIKDYE